MMMTNAGDGERKAHEGRNLLRHADQRAGKRGERKAQREDLHIDPIDIDANQRGGVAVLDDGAHRHAGAGIAEEQDAGETGNRGYHQRGEPVAGDARIANDDDIVEILIAAIVGREGERGDVLHDDRDAEEQ